MITSATDARIQDVNTTDDELIVSFVDGRTLSVPLVWYPRLFHASPEQRSDWQLIGDGDGVHWPQIDEDLSAAGMLRGASAPAYRELAQPGRSDTQIGGVIVKKPVHVTPREDGWAVVREGYAHNPSSVYRTQKEAAQRGREIARKDATFFYLHDRQGKIRDVSKYLNAISPKNAVNVIWTVKKPEQESIEGVTTQVSDEEEVGVSRVPDVEDEVHVSVEITDEVRISDSDVEVEDDDERITRPRRR